jgi:hypothetical protein
MAWRCWPNDPRFAASIHGLAVELGLMGRVTYL